jgi:DnaJ-class molecular chaperone
MFSDKNYYEILGIEPSASASEIKSAYRKMSLKYHPDKNKSPDAQSMFQTLNMAYDTLSELDKKNEYDTQLKGVQPCHVNDIFNMIFSDLRRNHATSAPQNIFFKGNFGSHPLDATSFTTSGFGKNNLGDFFEVFGQQMHQQHSYHQKPEQIVKHVKITIHQSYHGSKIPIEIERIIIRNEQMDSQIQQKIKETESETLYIDIVAGIDTNEIILIEDKGHNVDGIKGDVRLIIQVDNDSVFERNGLDLLYKKTISLKEALLGFSFDFLHLNGKNFKVNNTGRIIEPNFRTQLQNLGMIRENQCGSLFIEFQVAFPKSFTEEQITKLGDILE